MKTSTLKPIATASALALIVAFPNEPALAQGCPAPSFAAARTFAAGDCPTSVAVGDFNNDGRLDLAVANAGSFAPGSGTVTNGVFVLLGDGNGTFQPAINSPTADSPFSMDVGDFNSDGRLDLATAGNSTNLSILLGKGNGTFEFAVHFDVGQTMPRSVVVSDFNGDGKPDLATADSVLLGNGDGTFRAAVNYSAPGQPIAVGDFNDDGEPDLAVADMARNHPAPHRIWVLLGKGDATFEAAVPYDIGAPGGRIHLSVALGDFNSDGKLDLVVANLTGSVLAMSAGMSVLIGNGDGTFQPAINYHNGFWPVILTKDFNGDGKLDLAVAGDGVSVQLGNGNGTFQAPVAVNGGQGAFFLAADDFNGDGRPDLAVAARNYGLSILLNTCVSAGVRLDIVRSNNTHTLSWPLTHASFVLESTTSFSSTNWQGVSEAMTTNTGRSEVTVPLDQEQRYFRLRKG